MTDKKKKAPGKKKGMPEMKEKDRKDPHRGITDTPSQHEELVPDDEDDFDEELELDEDDDE